MFGWHVPKKLKKGYTTICCNKNQYIINRSVRRVTFSWWEMCELQNCPDQGQRIGRYTSQACDLFNIPNSIPEVWLIEHSITPIHPEIHNIHICPTELMGLRLVKWADTWQAVFTWWDYRSLKQGILYWNTCRFSKFWNPITLMVLYSRSHTVSIDKLK